MPAEKHLTKRAIVRLSVPLPTGAMVHTHSGKYYLSGTGVGGLIAAIIDRDGGPLEGECFEVTVRSVGMDKEKALDLLDKPRKR